jgi:predicted nucleic acid-binding protein
MIQPLSAFTSGTIYLDTMILYTFLRVDAQVRPVLRSFFARIEQREIIAYTSTLTFDELAYRLLLALIKDNYSGSPLDYLRKNEVKAMAEFYPVLVPQLQHLRRFPNLRLVNVTAPDVDLMCQFLLDYKLKPRDALHLTAMRVAGCSNLASNDHHFDAVPALTRYAISAL